MAETSPTQPQTSIQSASADMDYRRARECLAAQDLDGASHWLDQAAAKDHPGALTELAVTHLHGFGRPADAGRAVELLLRAEAVGGTPETFWLLAHVALGGVALPCDPARIDGWIVRSARAGYPGALRVAGLLFGKSHDEPMQRAAATCLKRATEARDPVAAALFADRLHSGRGIAVDSERARDLAVQLRAMGIPVELPGVDDDSRPVATPPMQEEEPPWEELQALERTPPEFLQHCQNPEIATCETLLNDEECRYLIYSGARFLERSLVVHPLTGRPLEVEVRTSQDMTFVPTSDDVGIRILQARMARLAGFAIGNCEPLTLLRYGPGDQYRPHRDYFFASAPQLAQPGGQRHSTVCTYLNDVEQGGQTIFPDKRVTVEPRRGRAVMFRSLHADGSPDPQSLHAGLPVLRGCKWLASCWIRVRTLREH